VANSDATERQKNHNAHTATRTQPRHLLVLAAIVALAVVVRFYALDRESLWFDEAFSASVAGWDVRWIILKMTELGLRSSDRNIFHLLLHYVLLLGRSEVTVRLIPAVSGVLSVVALYALGKRLLGQAVGLLAAFLLAISPFHVWFSREGRGYALLTLFGLLAAYFIVRALADNRAGSWAGYVILAALGAYTHLFGILIIGAFGLFALIHFAARRGPRRVVVAWVAAHAVLGLALLPLLLELTGQSSEGWGAWIGEKYGTPTLKSLGSTMGAFSFGTAYDHNRLIFVAALAVFAAICLAALASVARLRKQPHWWEEQAEPLLFALLYLGAPIGVLFIASQFTPLYLDRYLLPFAPPYLLIVARGLLAIPRAGWRALAAVCVLLVTVPARRH
jgi:mannosyltransferase